VRVGLKGGYAEKPMKQPTIGLRVVEDAWRSDVHSATSDLRPLLIVFIQNLQSLLEIFGRLSRASPSFIIHDELLRLFSCLFYLKMYGCSTCTYFLCRCYGLSPRDYVIAHCRSLAIQITCILLMRLLIFYRGSFVAPAQHILNVKNPVFVLLKCASKVSYLI